VSGYDIAAAQLVVRESNAIITDENGDAIEVGAAATGIAFICAVDRPFHAQIIDVLTNGTPAN
jgi:fructose-1,6-bisphosphatase/inositol monophosphatase family enzyme